MPMRDQSLADEVKAELDFDPQVEADAIGVSVHDGAVTLSGLAPSYAERLAAVRAAERVYGVQAVADEITVRMPEAFRRDDTAISEAIGAGFRHHVDIPTTVNASVHHGTVTLTGEVAGRYQSREAARLARNIKGVSGVVNQIKVKPKIGNGDVAQRVSHALQRHADLDARSIWVTSDNGAVHLHGHVHTLRERAVAQNVAFDAPGVAAVENKIEVRP